MNFEWNKNKATANFRKHEISFDEATTVFGDPLAVTYQDLEHSIGENRYLTFGRSSRGRLLIVSHTDRDDRIRPISAREMTRKEISDYEQF